MRCLPCGKVERQRNHKANTAYTVGPGAPCYTLILSHSQALNILRLLPYDLTRITCRHYVRWYIFCNHATRANNRFRSNCDSRTNNTTTTNPNIVLDIYRLCILQPLCPYSWVRRMCSGIQMNIGPKQNIISDYYWRSI